MEVVRVVEIVRVVEVVGVVRVWVLWKSVFALDTYGMQPLLIYC